MTLPKLSDAESLRATGLRATPHRLKLLSVLRKKGKPLSVAEVVSTTRGAFDTATAYRMLASLAKAGIVRVLTLSSERALYELAEGHHHHAVCVSCGNIVDISVCVSPSLDEKVRRTAGFERMSYHSLEFYGVCRSCATRS